VLSYHNRLEGARWNLKRELLSPAGNMETLKVAVKAGCDAVYVGGKKFGARAYAANFSNEELREAVFYCHLHHVKLYVTLNTMIYESELQEAKSYLFFLYQIHVDAVIMADFGLMRIARDCFPNLEIHASTQCHTHNKYQLELLKSLHVKRVVLARELTKEEILALPTDMEFEVFIHGALCISYSGQCLFSSLLLDRSGNRGECAGICRLPFTLCKDGTSIETDGNYLLSTKDLNLAPSFSELLTLPIHSFKIEGRMKHPAYVGYITKMYRRLLDCHQNQTEMVLSEKEMNSCAVLFNRGFTRGKFCSSQDQDYMNQKTSNHQGTFLGKVLQITKKQVKILLAQDLVQTDGIRFLEENKGMIVNFLYDERGKLIHQASKNDVVFVDNKIGVLHSKNVLKTIDSVLEKNVLEMPELKVPISMRVHISIEQGFLLEVTLRDTIVQVQKNIVFPALNAPIHKEKVIEQLKKLGNTPFVLEDVEIFLNENVFVNIRDLNEIRREAISQLLQEFQEHEDVVVLEDSNENVSFSDSLEIYASVKTEEQLITLLSFDITGIYVADFALFQKYQSCPNVFWRSSRVNKTGDYPKCFHAMAGETGAIMADGSYQSSDYFLNVANHAAANVFTSLGVKKICLSVELDDSELKLLLENYPNGNPFELLIYGRVEVMVLEHCLLRMNVKHDGICKACKGNAQYTLKDRNGAMYPISLDENHRTHIYYHTPKNSLDVVRTYYDFGIRKFRLDFVDEDVKTVQKILKKLKEDLRV